MKDVEEGGARRELELVTEQLDATHRHEHGDGRAEREEVLRAEVELRVLDERYADTGRALHVLDVRVRCRAQQRVAVRNMHQQQMWQNWAKNTQ